MSTILDEMRESYDWQQVFNYAQKAYDIGPFGTQAPGFTIDDVAEVIAHVEGENDEKDWQVVVELKDGRAAWISAGCDYTGWDCQASGYTRVGASLADLLAGIPREDKEILGIEKTSV